MSRYKERIRLTVSCDDCNEIPKCPQAGQIESDPMGLEVQLMHNGLKIVKDCYHEFMTTIIRELKGHHEPQEEKVFYEVLKKIDKGGVMLEVGANWAYYSLWFHQEVKKSRNFMIEPNASKLEVGRLNFSVNGFDGDFFYGSVGKEQHEETIFEDWDKKKYLIPQYSIDGFIEKNQIQKLSILHADIQGAEVEMLEGAKDALTSKNIDYLFVSTHFDSGHEDCKKLLQSFGYILITEHTISESYSEDGLLVYRSPSTPDQPTIEVSKYSKNENVVFKIRRALRIRTRLRNLLDQ